MKKLIYSIVLITFAACGGGSEERADGYSSTASAPDDSLFNVVMKEHNVAMAKQRQIEVYQKKIDSLDPKDAAKYKSLRAELKSAYDGMDVWMNEFSIDTLQAEPDKRAQYLSSEEIKVTKVKEDIINVLAKADSAFKK